jgi:hypothetical protein
VRLQGKRDRPALAGSPRIIEKLNKRRRKINAQPKTTTLEIPRRQTAHTLQGGETLNCRMSELPRAEASAPGVSELRILPRTFDRNSERSVTIISTCAPVLWGSARNDEATLATPASLTTLAARRFTPDGRKQKNVWLPNTKTYA